jgi:hypothetical protein
MDLKSHEIEALVNRFIHFKISVEMRNKESLWKSAEGLLRSSNFLFDPSTSESSMALTLVLGFFCLGYKPLGFFASDRTLVFEDDDGLILVRYRHREGIPTNVSYVRDLAARMDGLKLLYGKGLKSAYLFSSPGFSRNALVECGRLGIRYYGLGAFQDWLAELRRTAFLGPRDGVFQSLERLLGIVSQLR